MDIEAFIIISFVFIVLSGFIVLSIILLYKRSIKHFNELRTIKDNEHRKLLNAIIETQEKERDRIASDIHDELGPLLTVIKLELYNMSNHEILSPSIDSLINNVDRAIVDIRRISKDLSPRMLIDLGLNEAIQILIQTIEEVSNLNILYDYKVSSSVIHQDYNLTIYRIIQESLNNIFKHANAKNAKIVLSENEFNIKLLIEDDGDGFNVDGMSSGLGLRNIKARGIALNGIVDIKSKIACGTSIRLTIPKTNRND